MQEGQRDKFNCLPDSRTLLTFRIDGPMAVLLAREAIVTA